MVATTLTKEMIQAGEALILKLDEYNVRPDAAFWFYFPEVEQYKLVLAEVSLSSQGPKEIYKKVQETLTAHAETIGEISLEDVTLAKPDAPIVALLRLAIRTGPGVSGIRFTDNVINGTVIKDAYIYRLI